MAYERERELYNLERGNGDQPWRPGRVVVFQPPMSKDQAAEAARDIRRIEAIFR